MLRYRIEASLKRPEPFLRQKRPIPRRAIAPQRERRPIAQVSPKNTVDLCPIHFVQQGSERPRVGEPNSHLSQNGIARIMRRILLSLALLIAGAIVMTRANPVAEADQP